MLRLHILPGCIRLRCRSSPMCLVVSLSTHQVFAVSDSQGSRVSSVPSKCRNLSYTNAPILRWDRPVMFLFRPDCTVARVQENRHRLHPSFALFELCCRAGRAVGVGISSLLRCFPPRIAGANGFDSDWRRALFRLPNQAPIIPSGPKRSRNDHEKQMRPHSRQVSL